MPQFHLRDQSNSSAAQSIYIRNDLGRALTAGEMFSQGGGGLELVAGDLIDASREGVVYIAGPVLGTQWLCQLDQRLAKDYRLGDIITIDSRRFLIVDTSDSFDAATLSFPVARTGAASVVVCLI